MPQSPRPNPADGSTHQAPAPVTAQAGPLPVSSGFVSVPGSGVRRRDYVSYDQYVHHQAEKLRFARDLIEPSDAEYERIVFERYANRGQWVGTTVLCLGARLGGEVRAFKRLGALAIGVDLNPGPRNPHVLTGDFHSLQFPDACFDWVFTNALDHAFDLSRVAAEAFRVLRPGGQMLIELGLQGPGKYESLSIESESAVLQHMLAWFRPDEAVPITNRTSYLDWSGTLHRLVARDTVDEGALSAPGRVSA